MTPQDHIRAAIKSLDEAERHLREARSERGTAIVVDLIYRARLHAVTTLRDIAREEKASG